MTLLLFDRMDNGFYILGHVVLYHKSNLVYKGFFSQFAIFRENNKALSKLILKFNMFFNNKML